MKLIVGLGNPGRKYEQTRHNIGFQVIDELAEQLNISLNKEKFKGLFGIETIQGEKVILLKPLTYMNLSGDCIKPLMDFYKIENDEIIVIYDDLDLPTGKIRLRTKGSAGGHNGIKSIIHQLGSQQFNRVRIGVDRPQAGMTVVDYVLGRFSSEECGKVEEAVKKTADACYDWLTTPFLEVMNKYNK